MMKLLFLLPLAAVAFSPSSSLVNPYSRRVALQVLYDPPNSNFQESIPTSSKQSTDGAHHQLQRYKSPTAPPVLAVLGRPNVGKSSLVNRLASSQSGGAIVADESGITRDRTYRLGEFMNKRFQVVDTGGLVFDDKDGLFASQIREQAMIAIEEAKAVVLVTDGMAGVSR